ncbi:4-hydroxy-3-methylbut-2-enyl diphosphate reductase [Beggiatoa leptomitoformis]|uniref:4-hydroxy-3-methylbut-2-enyl diphosphate reductase n=1 Tax=Beggiatoa leptomitoformis TaxID=288004 RepID=A0A2N9YAT8_9GAMM|nr:4-hydroxy-3-methylbut-2-enyl diphosphate reductase [Beggiatoa leptomitoformis]ALG67037.1 4-hydroxy-3-methylbut-2-enyl diphosphate reductase [Beggiatoa leptomitoformis]AUI67585.1 4-hydroxy-3-methylbut-2-enyl diphosphate reductase [Beggiatoa leptomitoformis]
MNVILAQPRGFCAGVVRAIEIVEQALMVYPSPVYVLHEIVHNRYVVDDLRQRGAVFVETLDEVPLGAVCIFSAHGVAQAVVKNAELRQLEVIDATCPLVTKVHQQAQRYVQQGAEIVIIGHAGHPEVEGTRGRIDGIVHILSTVAEAQALQVRDPEKLAYVTQTTLSVDDTKDVIAVLSQRFPTIQGPQLSDICYATQNRQNAVRELATKVNLLLVVGAQNSSNSNRLREAGEQAGVTSYLIQDAHDLNPEWFTGDQQIGVTAGASAPEILIQGVLDRLKTFGVQTISIMDGQPENTTFKLPLALLEKVKQKEVV